MRPPHWRWLLVSILGFTGAILVGMMGSVWVTSRYAAEVPVPPRHSDDPETDAGWIKSQRADNLEQARITSADRLCSQTAELWRLAETIGTSDPNVLQSQQAADRDRLAGLQGEHIRIQGELRQVSARLAANQARRQAARDAQPSDSELEESVAQDETVQELADRVDRLQARVKTYESYFVRSDEPSLVRARKDLAAAQQALRARRDRVRKELAARYRQQNRVEATDELAASQAAIARLTHTEAVLRQEIGHVRAALEERASAVATLEQMQAALNQESQQYQALAEQAAQARLDQASAQRRLSIEPAEAHRKRDTTTYLPLLLGAVLGSLGLVAFGIFCRRVWAHRTCRAPLSTTTRPMPQSPAIMLPSPATWVCAYRSHLRSTTARVNRALGQGTRTIRPALQSLANYVQGVRTRLHGLGKCIRRPTPMAPGIGRSPNRGLLTSARYWRQVLSASIDEARTMLQRLAVDGRYLPPPLRRWPCRPVLEMLEVRWLPSTVTVNPINTAESAVSTTAIDIPVPMGQTVMAGDTIIVELALQAVGGTPSVTDSSAGGSSPNVYHLDADVTNGNKVRTLIFSAHVFTALQGNNGDKLTAHFEASSAVAVSAGDFCGILGVGALDRTMTGTGDSSQTPTSGLTAATRQADEVLIGAIGVQGNIDSSAPNGGFTPGTGYTALAGTGTPSGNQGNNNASIHPEYQVVSTTGTYQADGTLGTNANGKWATAIATYRVDTSDHYLITPSANPVTAGVAFSITVTAKDASNNTVTGHLGIVHFTTSDSGAGTMVPADYTFVAGDMGTHTFPNGVTLVTEGSQTITATDLACTSITGSVAVTVNPAAATHLHVTAPSSATASVPFNFTVTAQDPFNNTATSYTGTVHFTSGDAAATLPGNSTLTQGVGVFSATLKTLGTQTLTATDTANSSITGTSGPITVTVAPATHLVISAPSAATAGVAFNFTVTVEDQFNNLVPSYSGTVTFTSSNGMATLPGNSTLSNGTGTFSATLRIAGLQTLTATDTANGSISGQSGPITVSAATATHYTVQAPTSATAGAAFTFTVTAQDAFNNTAASYTGTVSFTSNDGNATLPGNGTLSNGIGTFSATLRTVGLRTITATDTANGSISGQSAAITVSAAAATHYTVQAPTSATAGTAFNFTITAQDAFNNLATAYSGTVSFSSNDNQGVLPSASTLSDGSGTFSAALKTAGLQTITATDTANASITGQSAAITVSAAAATHYTVSAPTSATAGTAFNFTVTVQDAFNNTATSYTGTVSFTSSDASGSLPSNGTLSRGTGTFSATLKTAGLQTLTATDTANGAITGQSATITVSAATATHYNVQAPTSATAGTAFNFTVTAQDAFNNTATAYSGTVTFSSNDSLGVMPSNSTLSSGTGTFSATLKTAGLQTITATDTANGSITGKSAAITVSAAATTHYTVQAPTSATAGTAFTFTVTAQDAFNNTATSYTGTVSFTSNDTAATLPTNSTLSSGTGTFSTTLRTAGLRTITATDTANGTITGQSGPITVSAATATHYTVAAPTSATVGAAFNFTVTAQDAFNNTATSYTGTVHFSSNDSQGVMPADSTLSSGNGTFSATLKTAGLQTLTATDTSNGSITGQSGPITVSAATATHYTVAAPTSATAGTAFTFTVTAQDAFNNTATSYTGTVSFTSNDSLGVMPSNSTLSSGTGTFSATLKTAGLQTITATDTANGSITGKSAAITVSAAAATHYTVEAPTSATAGTALNFTVTAQDAFNNTTTSYTGTVSLTSNDAAATLPGNSTLSSGTGTFGATLRTAGLRTITATDTANGSIAGQSAAITVSAATATHYTVAAPTSATAGTAFNFTVTAQDAFNNTATSYTGTAHFSSNDSQGVMPADSTLSSGNGTFSATLKTIGLRTLTATDTANGSITGQSAAITVSATTATHYTVSAPTSATAGTAFTFTVTAQDAFNNTATNYTGTVSFTTSDSLGATPSDSTLSNGTGTFSATLRTAGLQTLTATDTANGSITGKSAAITVSAAAATYYTVQAPSSATAGTAFNFTVTAQDAFNNTATSYTGTVHFASTDAQATSGAGLPSDSTLSSGNGTFSATLKTAGLQTITATDTANASITGQSNAITVSAAVADHFTVGAPTTVTAGGAFNFTVTAQDLFNNTATGYTGTVHFSSTDSAASLPANHTLSSGTGTFSATLNTVGTQTITATDTVSTSITGSSHPITVVAATDVTHFSISAPTNVTAGTAFDFTVTALNATSQVVPGYRGTVQFASSDSGSGVVLPSPYTFTTIDNGVHVFTSGATLVTAGLQTLTATDTANSSITGTSAAITVSAAAATHLAVNAPTGATAGIAFNFTVTAQDQFNNTASSYTGTVHFSSNDSQGATPADSTLSSGSGTFSATLKTAGLRTISATDTSNGSITGQSGPITVSAATATHYTVAAPTSATAGTAFNFTVTAQDAFNNTATSYTGTVHFTSSDAQATSGNGLPADSTLSSGSGTFSATLKTAGLQTITATDTANGSITGQSGAITVNAAVATHYTVDAPTSATAGMAFNFTVTAQDAFNNTTTSYTGTVSFSSSDGAATLPGNSTLSRGTGTFSATLRTSGPQALTATDTANGSITGQSAAITVSAAVKHFLVSGTGVGSEINLFDVGQGANTKLLDFYAYPSSVTGGVRVALGDINGDGMPDIVAVPGPGSPAEVRVFDGATGALLRDFYAFPGQVTAGFFVAAGDLKNERFADIVVGVDAGPASEVKAFDGRTGAALFDFYAYGAFSGGVRVAVGDVDGDGFADIITGTGPGSAALVRAFSGATGALIRDFYALPGSFTGGVFVASGDVNADGQADIIIGTDQTASAAGGLPGSIIGGINRSGSTSASPARVLIFDGRSGSRINQIFLGPGFTGGARVAAVAITDDGPADVFVGAGPGQSPEILGLNPLTAMELDDFFAYHQNFLAGIFIGGSS